MYSTLVRFALISCSDKQGHYVHLFCEVNLFTKFPESLAYFFIAYCCNFLHEYPRNFIFHLRILIVTLMNRSKVLQELFLYWQSLTSID